jgi:hypothetical protein
MQNPLLQQQVSYLIINHNNFFFFCLFILSDHLQLDVETVRTTIDSLLWLYTECAKTKVRKKKHI